MIRKHIHLTQELIDKLEKYYEIAGIKRAFTIRIALVEFFNKDDIRKLMNDEDDLI